MSFTKETFKDVTNAIWKAREAFEKHLTGLGYDVAYFDTRITAWQVSADEFKPMEKIELDGRDGQD